MTHAVLRPRRLLLATAALLLLVLAACEVAGWPFLREPLQAQLATRLQRQVRLGGEFRLHLLGSIRLNVGTLAISAPAWESAGGRQAPDFIRASGARLVVPYGTVFDMVRGNTASLRISLLEVDAIQARLVRLADGHANWRFAAPPGAAGASSGNESVPEFVHLVVHRGDLSLQDAVAGLSLAATARTREGSARDASGLFVRASGRYRGQDFTAEARSPGILPLVAPRGRTAAVALSFVARLGDPTQHGSEFRFRGRALDLLRFEGLAGNFRLTGPSLAAVGNALGVTLPSTAPFYMEGQADKQGQRWHVAVSRFDVGDTHLAGDFRYDSGLARPLLAGQLRGRQLRLRDLGPALGASPPPPGSDVAGSDPEARRGGAGGRHVLPQREFDIPSLHRMDADVDVAIERVTLGTSRLEDLQPLRGRLTLKDGVLLLDQLLARTAEGELQGRLRLDGRETPPLWSGDLHWSGIHLSHWIRQTNPFARGGTASPAGDERSTPHFLTGELAGQARFQGRGRSTAAMLGSLDGQVSLWIRDGSVSHLLVEAMGLDIAQGLGMVIKGDTNLPLRCAAISLKAQDGVLHTEAGVVDTTDTLLLLNGQVSLADETLGMRIEAHPHDRSPLSVRAPLLVQGTFAAPRVRPDLRKVGGKAVLATVLGTLLTPLAALIPLIDPGEPVQGKGCQATLARLRQKPGTPPAMKRALGEKVK